MVSVGLFVVSGDTIAHAEEQAETERVQQAFLELGHSMASVSTDKDSARTMTFEAGESGAVTKTEAGWIEIEGGDLNLTGERRIDIGAIEYESDDGAVVAYQSGGVWRETGNQTQMLSAPSLTYDHETETLTFPIMTVSGERDLTSGDVVVRHNTTKPIHEAEVVEHDTVTVRIQSDYYRGWETYFENQAGPTAVRDVDHDARTVTVELGHLELEDAFTSGITVSAGSDDQGNVDSDADNVSSGSFRELDDTIDRLIEDMEDGDADELLGSVDGSEGPLTNKTYLADGVDLDEDLVFDLEDGNATLVVNGSLEVADGRRLTVENWDGGAANHSLKVYVTGDVHLDGGDVSVEPIGGDPNAARLQVYGTSETHVGMRESTFEGILFAPSNDFYSEEHVITGRCSNDQSDDAVAQVCVRSNWEFTGSIVAHSTFMQGGIGGTEFAYDPTLKDADIDAYPEGYDPAPQITYLNIAIHELDVENE